MLVVYVAIPRSLYNKMSGTSEDLEGRKTAAVFSPPWRLAKASELRR